MDEFKNKRMRIVVALFVLITLVIGGYFFASHYMTQQKEKELAEQEVRETELLRNDSLALESFSKNSTNENKAAYISQLERTIAENANISEYTKNLLLLRKALALSTLRDGSTQSKEAAEATDIFNDLIAKYRTSVEPNEIFIRDYSIAGITQLHTQCCFEKSIARDGMPEYANFKSYQQKYGNYIATHLISNDLIKTASPYVLENDISLAQERLAIIRMILFIKMYAQSPIEDTLASSLAAEAELILKEFNKKLPLTYRDYYNSQKKPVWQSITAKDFYYLYVTQKNPSRAQSETIDAEYKNAFQKILVDDLGGDKVAIARIHSYLFHFYLISLHTRYPLDIARTMAAEQIANYVRFAKESPDQANYLRGLYRQGIAKDGKVNQSIFGSYLKIESDFPELAELHEYLGVGYTK